MCLPAWGHALAAAQRLRDDDVKGRDPGEGLPDGDHETVTGTMDDQRGEPLWKEGLP
ncbi:hypothetical protein [Micromonospora sp. NPDC049497]|uniref:hypothetical protein n=1 Tax=Micromonospora sp. NPDC049497 TaxID=3364273 RepID=UPI0037B2DE0B